MADTKSTALSEAPTLASYGGLITAIGAAFGAWKLFEPKIGRIRAIKTEVGRLEVGFRIFYQAPQYFLIFLSVGSVLFLGVAFLSSLRPDLMPAYIPKDTLDVAFSPENLIWVAVSLSAIAAIIYWNVLTRLLLLLARCVSLLPIPGLRNRFGPNGESPGWHQTKQVMEGADKGLPLMIDHEGVTRVAWTVLSRLIQNTGAPDYATAPAGLSASESANLALFGCILESNHYVLRWPTPKWSVFYSALADIQRKESLFTPAQLLTFQSGQAFFEVLRDRLEKALKARHQPFPPDRSRAAAADISRAWEMLKKRAQGDILRLSPPYARFLGGRVAWLDFRLRAFPQLNSDSMRPQLIKLLVRWNALPVSPGIFTQPFSKQQAWLLMQEGALRALPEMKEVTFYGTGQVAIARIAARQVMRRVVALIAEGDSSEAVEAGKKLGKSEWTRPETADFVLWSWAREAASRGVGDKWDKGTWRWKFEDGRVQRQS